MSKSLHIPVLLSHVLDVLQPQPGQVFVDCTLGLGGHSSEILRRICKNGASGQLIAFDLDPANIARATPLLQSVSKNFHIAHTNFAGLPAVLAAQGHPQVHGLLADVGVASTQIDDPDRGFSYRRPGPLDMRMDPTRGQPASALLAKISERDLAAALLDLGDEEDAHDIAALVVQRRSESPITTTQDLTAIVCEARRFTLQRAAGAKLHPAARTFQALRILVNRELANLSRLLDVLPDVLLPGASAAIISFHSGEDRLVKHAFKHGLQSEYYADISPDPITATAQEAKSNPRARSAKLRWCKKA